MAIITFRVVCSLICEITILTIVLSKGCTRRQDLHSGEPMPVDAETEA